MLKKNLLIPIIVLGCIMLLFISHRVAADSKDRDDQGSFKEIWIKLWGKNGRMLDLQIRIDELGSLRNSGGEALDLSFYPFQLDVSELGDLAAEDIQGIVSGYQVAPSGNPGLPLMVRWWIVDQRQSNPKAPHTLTLMLRTWDSDGAEFDPRRQQARLVDKGCLLVKSSGARL